MNLKESINLAIAAIWAHKLRSTLTLLGMIMGVTSVVVIVSLIQGFKAYVDDRIDHMGARTITVRRFDPSDYRDTDAYVDAVRRNKKLTFDDYEFLKDNASLVDRFGVQANSSSCQVKRGTEELNDVPIEGVTADIVDVLHPDIADGRYFTKAENDAGALVAFVGSDVAANLKGTEQSFLGQYITVCGIPYRVLGIANFQGAMFGQAQDNYVAIPFKTYSKTFADSIRQQGIFFVATPQSNGVFDDVVDELRSLMRIRRHLNTDEKDNFGIVTPDGITGMRDRILGPVYLAAIVIPGISLLIGGIVIMNIMLVSVTERTREIGIRKSLGARRSDILKQFLVEAITLCAMGGVVSIFVAYAITQIVTAFGYPTPLSITAIVLALTVSGAVGLLSGFFPAWRAAHVNPNEALLAE